MTSLDDVLLRPRFRKTGRVLRSSGVRVVEPERVY